jgi:hypothetical protein
MLCKVLALSLPAIQLLANTEEPNGVPPMILPRCGMDPALSLESNAWLLEAPAEACCSM